MEEEERIFVTFLKFILLIVGIKRVNYRFKEVNSP